MKQGAAWCGVVPALEAVKSGEYVDVDAGGERGMRCELSMSRCKWIILARSDGPDLLRSYCDMRELIEMVP
ncbi:MAG: hypothetical protein BA861_02600 [Desulfobacterales bacterium S3730MH5]|nr:MAG: hypothetical protein BA861_02600 [Desulfobacterales bacterium S3730MH5]OEU82388.1 MAG: hypothetical protein BA865_03010 [Desulfobacterales bacterium S5133MH4]